MFNLDYSNSITRPTVEKMTEQELREKIVKLYQKDCEECTDNRLSPYKHSDDTPAPDEMCGRAGMDEVCNYQYWKADEILALIKKAYAKLADDQGLPNPQILEFSLPTDTLMVSKAGIALEKNLLPTYSKAQQDMLKAGWRKVEDDK